MQQPSYLDDIQHIIRSIDIDANGGLHFQGASYPGYDYPEASQEARLFHNLNNLLYSACYTRGGNAPHFSENTVEDDTFLAQLRAANTSAERYDCGWIVAEIEHGGNILVRKGGHRRYTYAGDFIREHFGHGPLQRGEVVNLRVLSEHGTELQPAEVFYFVFGDTLLENNSPSIVRFYFHLIPEGATALIALISSRLNAYSIPFQFKCLNRATLFTRSDSAVLYVDKRYFNIAAELLAEGCSELEKCLKPETPMFTQPFLPGISFAENPFSSGESFGTSRCKVIAQAIISAWKEGRPKSDWAQIILQQFQKNFLLPEALFLNPNSKYPYQLPEFQN